MHTTEIVMNLEIKYAKLEHEFNNKNGRSLGFHSALGAIEDG